MMGQPQINRIIPNGDPHEYKTYAILNPRESHTRSATCAEVDCQAQAGGWRSRVDESGDLGQAQAHYIRTQSGRSFSEEKDEQGFTVFTFSAGQQCFAEHRISLERPSLFVVRDGDWRGNPRGTDPALRTPDEWVDDFANHQSRLKDIIDRG